MKNVRIKELCELRYGKSLKKENRRGGDIPVFGSNGIVGYHNEPLVNKQTIIVGRKGSIGEVHLATTPSWPIDTTYFVEFKEPDLNIEWFYRLLKTLRLNQLNRSAAIPGLNRDDVYRIKISLPPIDDQIRIAALLSRVETLIATRKNNLRLLDDFLKSTFYDMFGIFNNEYKKWASNKLSELTEIVSGVTKGKRYKDIELIEVPYMRVANVQDGHLDLKEIKTINVSVAEYERFLLQSDDLLLTEGGDPDKLGRGTIWKEEIPNCIHQNHIFRVRISDKKLLNAQFLSTLVGSVYGKSYFLKAAKQTTGIASINSTQLKKFPLFVPPIKLQNQFATIAEKIERIKNQYQENLSDIENLYGVLSQRAFRGELDLSNIPVDVALLEQTELAKESAAAVTDPTTDLASIDMPMSDANTRERIIRQHFDAFLLATRDISTTFEELLYYVKAKLAGRFKDSDVEKFKIWLADAGGDHIYPNYLLGSIEPVADLVTDYKTSYTTDDIPDDVDRKNIIQQLCNIFVSANIDDSVSFDELWHYIYTNLVDLIQEPDEVLKADEYELVKKMVV